MLDLDTQQVSHCDANCERMRCEVFLEQGQCVGSGVVEAGCMTVVRNRCIRSGMHLTVDGAKAFLAVCCSVIGRRYKDCGKRNPAAA